MNKNILKNIFGTLAGAVAGFLYYYYIGCNNGSCAIKSNPYLMTIMGAIMGYLLFDLVKIKSS